MNPITAILSIVVGVVLLNVALLIWLYILGQRVEAREQRDREKRLASLRVRGIRNTDWDEYIPEQDTEEVARRMGIRQ